MSRRSKSSPRLYTQNCSSFFWFLLYALLWTVLRVAQSLPEVAENAKLSLCVLYLIYPCVIYSFLLPSYHYIYVPVVFYSDIVESLRNTM